MALLPLLNWDNILAHSAMVESSLLCDAASNLCNNLFSNSLQYSWRFATATSNPLLAVAFPVAGCGPIPFLPKSSSANDRNFCAIEAASATRLSSENRGESSIRSPGVLLNSIKYFMRSIV
uniref:Uncharacterized protein n=1 Tax=Opuntia streptacantha TaxID=393608 RepID=A0A7C9AN53_OPUST